jgi:hypothetical protein
VGIIAALAVMAATLVAVVGNMQFNTYADRMEVKADTVTEAALDVGMSDLAAQWPTTDGAGPAMNTSTFRGMFDGGQFPDPESGGSFAAYAYFDNPPYTSPYSASAPPDYDANQDNRMYLVSQAQVGRGAARMQALVEITYFKADFPRGVAVFTGANLISNGGGNNPKITVEVAPATGTVSCRAAGTIEEGATSKNPVYDTSTIIGLEGTSAGSVEEAFPSSILNSLVEAARDNGRYFDGPTAISDAESSPARGSWSDGGLTGLTVIEPDTAASTLSLRGTYNSETEPGVIILLGGSNLDFGGGGDFYGVLYTQGTVEKGHGNFVVHGMLVSDSTLDMRGTVNVQYNDNCIANLSKRFYSNVTMVANTWRELRPE